MIMGPRPKQKGNRMDFDSTPANVTRSERLYEMTVEISFVSLVIAPYWCVSCEMAHCKEQLQPRGNRVSDGSRGRTSDADLLKRTPPCCRASLAHTHARTQVMLYYADLLKVNLITLVIPDQRVFLPAKKSQVAARGKWRKTWQQIKKWFHEGGTKDEPIHQSGGGVWTCCHAWCQARCQAVWGNPPCQQPRGCVPSSQGRRGC